MGDFRIGSILGFEIRLDFSWFIIFFLILWVFTFGVFPSNYPGLSSVAYLAMGVSGTLLFFASLLAHEISHSLVARAKGIPVEGITLFIFGGMSRTRMEAETPGDEFKIAGIGPLSSVVIAALFWGVGWLALSAGWSLAVVGVAQYLALLNFLLAVFNLLPGYPLDGGRLFRAAAWKYSGDYTKATRWATTGGKWLAYVLIAFGLLSVFQGNLGGLWLVLIGWFLRNAAVASYQQHLLQQVLEEVRARDAMTPEPETVPPDLTLQELVDEHFLRRRYHAFPVVRDDRPLGLITLAQVKEVPREEWPRRTVAETMTSVDHDSVTVRPEERMSDVLQKMEQSGARRVLVTRDGHLEGIITTGDVAGWLQRARELEG
ncbi:MAG TPA: site-2 protease family protein [Longimicrobiales bacterium]